MARNIAFLSCWRLFSSSGPHTWQNWHEAPFAQPLRMCAQGLQRPRWCLEAPTEGHCGEPTGAVPSGGMSSAARDIATGEGGNEPRPGHAFGDSPPVSMVLQSEPASGSFVSSTSVAGHRIPVSSNTSGATSPALSARPGGGRCGGRCTPGGPPIGALGGSSPGGVAGRGAGPQVGGIAPGQGEGPSPSEAAGAHVPASRAEASNLEAACGSCWATCSGIWAMLFGFVDSSIAPERLSPPPNPAPRRGSVESRPRPPRCVDRAKLLEATGNMLMVPKHANSPWLP